MIVKSILSDCSLLRLFYHLRPTLARGFELYPPPRPLPLLFLLDENEEEDDEEEDENEDEEDIEPLDFELPPSAKPPVPLLLLLSLPPLHDDQDPEIQDSP